MGKSSKKKSIERGISSDIALKMLNDALGDLLNDDELFLGIRNGYCNLYYHCDSIGKIEFRTRPKGLAIKTHKEYLPDKYKNAKDYVVFLSTNTKDSAFSVAEFCRLAKRGGDIRKIIDGKRDKEGNGSDSKPEKTAQQKLVLDNNSSGAEWFCVDLEYVQERLNSKEHNFGRFDILAIKKSCGHDGKHPVAIIELKVGAGAYGGAKNVTEFKEKGKNIKTFSGSLGSGLLGHFSDFYRFQHWDDGKRFEQLKRELCNILGNKIALGLSIPSELHGLQPEDLNGTPEFYFLTLCTENHKLGHCKKSFKKYINNCPCGKEKASTNNVTKVFAGQLMKDRPDIFDNYHFLFSKDVWNSEVTITDILSPEFFEEIDHSELFLPRQE